MFTHYSTPVFILEGRERKEADMTFTLFSEKFGRVEVVGKSIRKIGSKLRGGIFPFSVSEVEFVRGRHFNILTYAKTRADFPAVKRNLSKLCAAYKIKEVFNLLVRGKEEDKDVWRLLIGVFRALDRESQGKAQLLYLFFLSELLSYLGYCPELHTCLDCGGKLKRGKLYFCPQGGIICPDCQSGLRKGKRIEIDVDTVKVLREMEKGLERVLKLKADRAVLINTEKVLDFYISYI